MKALYSPGQLDLQFFQETEELKELRKLADRLHTLWNYFDQNMEAHWRLIYYTSKKWFETSQKIQAIENPEYQKNMAIIDSEGWFRGRIIKVIEPGEKKHEQLFI